MVMTCMCDTDSCRWSLFITKFFLNYSFPMSKKHTR